MRYLDMLNVEFLALAARKLREQSQSSYGSQKSCLGIALEFHILVHFSLYQSLKLSVICSSQHSISPIVL